MCDLIKSISVSVKPADRRCRYWAKVLRAGCALPLPSAVDGANDVPNGYHRVGDEELFAGDFLIEGEENSHRRYRGWTYYVVFMTADGEMRRVEPSSAIKDTLKANGLDPSLLAGSGDVAACIRIIHAVRAGIPF